MKQISTLLLATLVAISSFAAEPMWTPLGASTTTILSFRLTSKVNSTGEGKAQVRFDYLVPIKSTDDRLVAYSEMEIVFNCSSRDAKMKGDKHFAKNGGKEMTKDTNTWTRMTNGLAPDQGSPVGLVMDEVCPAKNKNETPNLKTT